MFLDLSYPHLTALTLESIRFSPRVSAEVLLSSTRRRCPPRALSVQGNDGAPETKRPVDRSTAEIHDAVREFVQIVLCFIGG
ncbi:hypothetical protein BV25DRAFT_1828068 [Artomyces pyxidatus]|uniref:Uncharacterized protein n=1 Tax=Artomyces pyxidatus TaxID=48021 RepID=A0ACB8SWE1_9AGAM|nr:hypothetical protein BV25DRAFT_1828068 [Artomyces pyxidatus]